VFRLKCLLESRFESAITYTFMIKKLSLTNTSGFYLL